MTNIKLVINCGPCQDYVGRCVASVMAQSYEHWQAYVTVDATGDATYERAVEAAQGDRRFDFHRTAARRYSMYNHIDAIRRSRAAAEDVIATLDGDDWFSSDDALAAIAGAYEKYDCWITYGSWLSNAPRKDGTRDGLWPAYPEGEVDFRRHRFLGTAVRTWKKWLWDHLRDSDLHSATGDYARVSEDQMIMIPLLEMAGTARARHIAAPLMTYNKLARYAPDESLRLEGLRNGDLLAERAPYTRLEAKTYAPAAAL